MHRNNWNLKPILYAAFSCVDAKILKYQAIIHKYELPASFLLYNNYSLWG